MITAKITWVSLWSLCFFAPSIMLGFTDSRSKVSVAVILAAGYVGVRILFGDIGVARKTPVAVALLLAVYLCVHGAILAVGTGHLIVILLQGQWVVYLLAGLFVAYDVASQPGGAEFLSRSFVALCVLAAAGGLVSIWTGPFYNYAFHTEGRWGLLIPRAVGTFEAPGMLAAMLAIGFILAALQPNSRRSMGRIVCLTVIAVALFLTQAKGGILACFAACAVGVPVTALLAGAGGRRSGLLLKATAACAFGIMALVAAGAMYELEITRLLKDDAQDRTDIRMAIIRDYMSAGPAAQLFGIGYRQSATVDPLSGIWFTAHNSYVSFLREIGLLGFGLTLILLLRVNVPFLLSDHLHWGLAMLALLLVAYTESYLYSGYCVMFVGGATGVLCGSGEIQFKQWGGRVDPAPVVI